VPPVTRLDATRVTITVAGYGVRPNNDLLNHRTLVTSRWSLRTPA
jgi:hypothetical protein